MKHVTTPKPVVMDTTPVVEPEPVVVNGDDKVVDDKEISYEEAIATYQHDGESLIARELRETREREEELRKMRERLTKSHISSPSAPVQKHPVPVQHITPTKTEPVRHVPQVKVTNSVPSKTASQKQPTVSFNHHMLSKSVDVGSPVTNGTPVKKEKKRETPIEREIRIARERENELRRQKGLPELVPVEQESSEDEDTVEEVVVTPRAPQRQVSNRDQRNSSSSRLQRELQRQRERELSMQKEGKILSTSEDHIQSFKYADLIGSNQSDAPVKRNFVTRKSISSEAERTPSEHSDNESLKDIRVSPRPVVQPQVSREEPKFKPIKVGGPTFSFRESSQKAESMIEKELREMREREEELK